MKTLFRIAVLAVLLVAASPCFALTIHIPVSKEKAKEMGMEVRTTATGPDRVSVQLEFKTEGRFVGRVELRIGEGNDPPVIAPLKEDRSKPGRVVVSFTADRTQVDKLKLWVVVPEPDGRRIYDLRVKDFVEPKKDP
jgi:hypothetical protein